MDQFYYRNVAVFFIGDGKKARDRARLLYSEYGMISYIFDSRPSLLSRLSPCIKAISTRGVREDALFLHLIDSVIERSGRSVFLLIADNPAEQGIIERNKEFFQTRFITDPDIISGIAQ